MMNKRPKRRINKINNRSGSMPRVKVKSLLAQIQLKKRHGVEKK